MPHCLYEGTLTDLSGFFFLPVRGLWREDFFFFNFHCVMTVCTADYLTWLFIILAVVAQRPSAFFFPSLFGIGDLSRAHQCPILRVTSTSPRALWLFIRVRLTGPRLWLPRGMKTWRGRHLAQPSVLTPDRPLSPPRPVRASPVRCHTPRIRPRDSHPTW